MKCLISTLLALAIPAASHASFLIAESTFDAGNDGWDLRNDATDLTWTDGHLMAADRGLGQTWYWDAPDAYLGDQSLALGGRLEFDLSQSLGDAQYADEDVYLLGGGMTLAIDAGDNPAIYPEWSSYVVGLDAAAGWKVDLLSGRDATAEELATVLGGLTGVYIRGEYRTGEDVGRLDNVRLHGDADPVPEPATVLLVGLGLAGVAAGRLRNRRR